MTCPMPNLVNLGDVPLQEADMAEQTKAKKHLKEEDGNDKGVITRLPFEI